MLGRFNFKCNIYKQNFFLTKIILNFKFEPKMTKICIKNIILWILGGVFIRKVFESKTYNI